MITYSTLTSGNSTADATSYNTAPITPLSNKLILVFVSSRYGSAEANTPTLSGNSLTWTEITHRYSTPRNGKVTAFRAIGIPSSGAITIDFDGQTQQNCHWAVLQLDGVVVTGTNASDAVVQTGTDAPGDGSTTASITLSAISLSTNAVFGEITKCDENDITPGSGFTEIVEIQGDSRTTQVQWQIGTDNTCDWSFAASNDIAAIAFEVKALPASGFFAFM